MCCDMILGEEVKIVTIRHWNDSIKTFFWTGEYRIGWETVALIETGTWSRVRWTGEKIEDKIGSTVMD